MSEIEIDNVQDYLQKFNIISKASVGVVLTRTREPFRVLNALRDYVNANNQSLPADRNLVYKDWNVLRGWAKYELNKIEPVGTDGKKDPFEALNCLAKNDKGQSDKDFGDGVYAMMYPHFQLSDNGRVRHVGMTQLLKQFSAEFGSQRKRLVLVVPMEYPIPPELEDDIVIVDFDTPSHNERQSIYNKLMNQNIPEEKRPNYDESDVNRILAVGAGMTAREFQVALARSLATNKAKLPKCDINDFIVVLADIKTEIVKRSEVLELVKSDNMKNVGGLEELKEWIHNRKACFTEEAREFGVDVPKGVALIGPPGTGKSLIAKAISSELGIPLIRFDIGKVFNSLVGSSEARIRTALKMVESIAPCVLWIDEVDKAFDQKSGGGDSGVGKRVLGTFLTWMNDTTAPVFTTVTANDVSGLPPEFLRKGRLDEIFSVSIPSKAERMEVLRIHLRKRGKNPDDIKDLADAIEPSAGYVPAELESAVKEALIEAYNEKTPITGQSIVKQLKFMKPLSVAFKDKFEAMRLWAENNARPASRKHEEDEIVETQHSPASGGGNVNVDLT